MVARAAGEPSAKRAKVDEADEEEDPLVRRKEELVVAAKEARSREDARAERVARRELMDLCARLGADNEEHLDEADHEVVELLVGMRAGNLMDLCGKVSYLSAKLNAKFRDFNDQDFALGLPSGSGFVRDIIRRCADARAALERNNAFPEVLEYFQHALCDVCRQMEVANDNVLLGKLPPEMWQKIVDDNLHQNDLPALAMTCRFFREKQKDFGWKMETDWTSDRVLELQKSGKVASYSFGWYRWVCDTFEILPGCEWDDEERVKGAVYEGDLLNYAAFQGSVEILRWLVEEKGCEPNEDTGLCAGMGGSVEVLEYLLERGYEFDEKACHGAASEGHLDALKFLRGLDPPCPWDDWTCLNAAEGGHLDVLKWARSQDPPCPWSRGECRLTASNFGHEHVVEWIDQQEDGSDV